MAGKTKTYTQAEVDALLAKQYQNQLTANGFNLSSAMTSNSDVSQVSKSITKLTPASARTLLSQVGLSIEYTQKLSDKDVQDFVDYFNKEQAKQIAEVSKVVSTRVASGASPEAIQKQFSNVLQTEFPSYLRPEESAKNFLWSKVNFGDAATLSGRSITALQSVRQTIKDFNLLGVSDAEALNAAKSIAMGKKTIDDYKAELSQIAQKEYPNLASRFASTPGLTTKDIASPIINMLAKEWEVDPNTIGFDNQIVQKWLHPTGADGKPTTYSYTDALREARNDPKWQQTTAANESARSAATSLARAFGFGV